ncbi:MAG: hypothetical protein ACOYJW_05535 [Candidatus Omnitrophota bacterium]|jgi:hypothetical protein
MITINLLPQEFRRTRKPTMARPYLPLAILAGSLFMLLTLFFYADYLKAKGAYDSVHSEWMKLSPQMQQLKTLEQKVEVEMRGEKEFLEHHVLNTDSMTRILQLVSENLPKRGWLTELTLERAQTGGGDLVLQGVVLPVSARTGIEQIEGFLQELKSKYPRMDISLTTAKVKEKDAVGTSFSATIKWSAEVS